MDKIKKKIQQDIYNGVYNNRVVGLFKDKYVVYYDREHGYIIGNPYLRKPAISELKEIKIQFGDLEKKLKK